MNGDDNGIVQLLNDDNSLDFISSFKDSLLADSLYSEYNIISKYYSENLFLSEAAFKKGSLILNINIQSLGSKFLNFTNFLDVCKSKKTTFDFIAVQEVWKIIEPNPYNIPNYKLFFSTRKHGNGGGIAFYVNNSISANLSKSFLFLMKIYLNLYVLRAL